MTTVTRATYTTLMAMKDEFDRNIKLHHRISPRERSAWIVPAARRTINDTLKRVHLADTAEAKSRGITIPPYEDSEYIDWDHAVDRYYSITTTNTITCI